MRVSKKHLSVVSFIVAALAIGTPLAVNAATTATSDLTQVIGNGTISTDIRNASNAVVTGAAFAMSPVSASTSQQTSTGTFGTSSQRISVDNPAATSNGWNLTLNATNPATDNWLDSATSKTYKYNGSAAQGQLTVSPSAGTITALTGGNTGVTLGSSAAFSGSTPITLMSASSSAANIWNGYVTGIGLSQTIPAAQATGSYKINMTQTIVAL